jgi:hypothetical protein
MTAGKKTNVVIAATDVTDQKVDKVVDILDDGADKPKSKKPSKAKEDKHHTNKKKQTEVMEPTQPVIGEVVVIIGKPQANPEVPLGQVLAEIGEAASNFYENIQVIPVPRVDVVEAAEQFKWLGLESNKASEKHRAEALRHAFEVAQKWSTGTGLTPRERVHGAVRDLYEHYGEKIGLNQEGRAVHVSPGNDYDQHFELHFAEDIKMRTIRAAKDLFGTKKEGA